MWSALTSDLNEFVSTVAGDTSEALNRMDENFPDDEEQEELSPAEEERLRRMEMHETFDSPLISDDDPDDYKKDVAHFLADFAIDDKTDEISTLLEENPDTLKLAFEALVPTKVSYEEFWKRYFYRCDIDRITSEIEEEEKQAAAVREQAFQSLSSVGNFLGGAVKAVSKSLSEDDKGASADEPFQMSQNQAGKAGIFGSGGRPPFVMNTAVSEDDDEEDEELGWDDDDEGEEEGEEDHEEGQIEFNDAVTEKLQEELRLATEERDQLHETVAMHQKEIAALKSQGAENTEIEKLKTQLFEKESEIAALRASAMDNCGTTGDGSTQGASNREEKRLSQELSGMKTRLEEETKAHAETRKDNSELASKISTLKSTDKTSSDESANLKSKNSALETKLEASEKRAKSLEGELLRLEAMLRQHKEDHGAEDHGAEDHGAEEHGAEEHGAEEHGAEEHGAESVDSPINHGVEDHGAESVDSPITATTDTSGVKVEGPAVPKAGEGEGWDDDW